MAEPWTPARAGNYGLLLLSVTAELADEGRQDTFSARALQIDTASMPFEPLHIQWGRTDNVDRLQRSGRADLL